MQLCHCSIGLKGVVCSCKSKFNNSTSTRLDVQRYRYSHEVESRYTKFKRPTNQTLSKSHSQRFRGRVRSLNVAEG